MNVLVSVLKHSTNIIFIGAQHQHVSSSGGCNVKFLFCQVRHSWLHLLVRGVVQDSNFLLLSALAQTS